MIGFANDLQKCIIDRFRSLPMSRIAVILGRTTSDMVVSVIALVVMSICGLLVGWEINTGFGDAVLGYLIMLLFAWALSWVGALIGLLARSIEVAQSAGLIWLLPVSFISAAFVPLESLPGPLQVFATWNPFTAVINATRELFGNTVLGMSSTDAWPIEHSALYAVLSCVAIIAIFAPLSVSRYRRVASK